MEDTLYRLINLYNKIPRPLQKIIGRLYYFIPYIIKYGRFYKSYNSRIKHFTGLSYASVTKKQEHLLFENVNYAISHIPFYKKFNKVTSIEQFRKLPIVNKQIIKDNFSEFVNPLLTDKKLVTNTGGSSGSPFMFYLEKNVSRPKEKAHFDWYWGKFGYKPSDKVLMVRGMPLRKNQLFEYRALDNRLNISCYLLNKDNIEEVLKEINNFKPNIIHAYPSSLKILTSLLRPLCGKLDFKVTNVFLGSEYLPEGDREYFKKFYQANVVNWYGHTERLLHGGNCKYTDSYHFYPFYGYLELLDKHNNVITQPGKEGMIVATGFDNKVMPFIRYNTGDIGVLSDEIECKCGFKGPTLKSITGRGQDVILLSDNTEVSLTAFIFGQHLKEFEKIRALQIYQEKKGIIELRIVKNEDFSKNDERSISKTLLKSVDNKIEVKIKYFDELDKTVTGKHKFLISSLKN